VTILKGGGDVSEFNSAADPRFGAAVSLAGFGTAVAGGAGGSSPVADFVRPPPPVVNAGVVSAANAQYQGVNLVGAFVFVTEDVTRSGVFVPAWTFTSGATTRTCTALRVLSPRCLWVITTGDVTGFTVHIAANDPALRTASGGYITPVDYHMTDDWGLG
jgi:hypothetical protein